MKPVILLDVDGCIGNFVGMICPMLNRRFATHYTEVYFNHWDLRETLETAESKWLDQALRQEGIAAAMGWYPGAKEFVEELKSLGTVLALTAPYQSSPYWPYERQQWLKLHFDIPMLSVPGEYKHLVQGDYLIEDKLMTVDQWGMYRPGAILLDQPWNQDTESKRQNYDRCFTYDGIVNRIRNEGLEFTL